MVRPQPAWMPSRLVLQVVFPARRLLQRNGASSNSAVALSISWVAWSAGQEVVTHHDIHGGGLVGSDRCEGSLPLHISALRKALGDGPPDVRYVVNVPGRGYCFVAPVTHLRATGSGTKATAPFPRGNARSLPPALARMGARRGRHEVGVRLWRSALSTIVGPGGWADPVRWSCSHRPGGLHRRVRFYRSGSVRDAGQVCRDQLRYLDRVQVFTEIRYRTRCPAAASPHAVISYSLRTCDRRRGVRLPRGIQTRAGRLPLATSREPFECGRRARSPAGNPADAARGRAITVREAADYPAIQLFLERRARPGVHKSIRLTPTLRPSSISVGASTE